MSSPGLRCITSLTLLRTLCQFREKACRCRPGTARIGGTSDDIPPRINHPQSAGRRIRPDCHPGGIGWNRPQPDPSRKPGDVSQRHVPVHRGGLYCAPTPPLEVSPLTWDIATTSKRCKSLQNCLAVCAGGSTTGWTKRSQTPAAGPDATPLPFRR